MLERSTQRIPGWSLAFTLAMLPLITWAAESLPASVRACTAETDSLRRLMCFDREVARFPDPKAAASQAKGNQPSATASTPPTPPPPAAAPNDTSTSAPAPKAPDSTGKPGRIVARVVSIDRSPNEMVLHLDNGQVWQDEQAVGDLSLKVGDSVTIDKHFGSYYLNGPHVSGMKVRQN